MNSESQSIDWENCKLSYEYSDTLEDLRNVTIWHMECGYTPVGIPQAVVMKRNRHGYGRPAPDIGWVQLFSKPKKNKKKTSQ